MRSFFAQETTEIPAFYKDRIRRELGPLWKWLPEGAIEHDPNAYSKIRKEAETAAAVG